VSDAAPGAVPAGAAGGDGGAGAVAGGGGGADGGGTGRRRPAPARFRPRVRYEKDEVFEICSALALAEAALARLGRPVEASRMAAAFDLAEGRLAG